MIKNKILVASLILFLLVGLGLIVNKGVKKQEEAECYQWQQNEKTISNWYNTIWQKEQCLNYGIELK